MSDFSGQLGAAFERAAALLPGRAHKGVAARRRSALDAFLVAGLPGSRDERWKYTSLRALERRHFALAAEDTADDTPPGIEGRLVPGELDAWRMTFVNGRFVPALSVLDGLPDGVHLGSLRDFLETRPEDLESLPGQVFAGRSDAFALLNSAFMHEGLVLTVPDGVRLERPVHLVYLGASREASLMSHLHHIIRLGENARATIIEHWLDSGHGQDPGENQDHAGHDNLTNTLGTSVLGQAAQLTHLRLQQDSPRALLFDRHDVFQGEASHYVSHTFDFGGQLVRHDLNTFLAAPGARCELNGLYLLDGRQHADNHTRIAHQAGDCTSSERYKGVLNEKSRAVFDGLVLVQAGADGTDAQQFNANLLLSSDAEVDTKPQLEIYADDVSCSHGATVGQLDEDAMFYLRSRGLEERTARGLLMRGFGMEMVDRVDNPELGRVLEGLLDKRLSAFGESGS